MGIRKHAHEALDRSDDVRMGSDQSFGLVLAVVFAVVAGVQAWDGAPLWAGIWLAVAAAFATAAVAVPKALHSLNRLWFRFGLLLHRIVTPVILALMFYLVVLPTGLALRLFGKNPLRLNAAPGAKSYWVERDPAEITPESLRNQF